MQSFIWHFVPSASTIDSRGSPSPSHCLIPCEFTTTNPPGSLIAYPARGTWRDEFSMSYWHGHSQAYDQLRTEALKPFEFDGLGWQCS